MLEERLADSPLVEGLRRELAELALAERVLAERVLAERAALAGAH
jgi:hypothetical protein